MKLKLLQVKLAPLLMLTGIVNGIFLSSCDDEEKPKTIPLLTTSEVTNITTTTATGGGEITSNGNADITISGLVYSSVVTEPTLGDSKTEETVVTGAFASSLTGLTSGTTYYVRAYATNSIGTGYGDVKQFITANQAPGVSNVVITGAIEVNKNVTATYTYSDPEGDQEGTSTFQWYAANDMAGTGAVAIAGANSPSLLIQEAQNGKYIAVGVIPKAVTGTITGQEVKSTFAKVGEATTVTFTYNGAEVTYGIITSSSTGRKWLDRNLGAPNAPLAANDYLNYGDLFQWGRRGDGHQRVTRTGLQDANATMVSGTTTTQSSSDDPGHNKFIIRTSGFPVDWRNPQNNNLWQGVNGVNNPCPTGWRIPTRGEWKAENLTNLGGGYSKLKITLTGGFAGSGDGFFATPDVGFYWTSEVFSASPQYVLYVIIGDSFVLTEGADTGGANRGDGYACRCIKD